MLALLGIFKFEIQKTNFDKIKHILKFNFKTHHKLSNFDAYQSVGKFEELLEINGILIAKSQKQLFEFELLAKMKEPITFVTSDIVRTVLIIKLEKEKTYFLKDGAFIKQSYKITLVIVGDGINIS